MSDQRRQLFLAACGVVFIGRLWFCTQVPVNTGDILRWIHVALYVLRDGPGVLGSSLVELDSGLGSLSWATVPYSYPPLALPFFVVTAAISPTIFAAKLGLTLIEVVNGWLLSRITGHRWLGLAYFASPVSIWWVSGEGQFEPLMALFMFASVHLVRTKPVAALALVGIGVHVKVTAGLLVPWLLWTVWSEQREMFGRAAGSLAAALAIPLLLALPFYPVIEALIGIASTNRYNPYYWNLAAVDVFLWNPRWLIGANAVASYGAFIGLLYLGVRGFQKWPELFAALAFLVAVKTSSLAQFWYFALFPAFVMTLEKREGQRDWRIAIVLLAPLLDIRSLVQLLTGPFGWVEVGIYDGFSALTPFGIR